MTFWVAGALVTTAVIGSRASKKAGKVQERAAEEAGDLEYRMFQEQMARDKEIYEEQRAIEAPWQEAGVNALAQISAGVAPGGEFAGEFTGADLEQEPGYQFRLREGLKSLDRQAAARGGLISGGALKAATRYGQEYASGEYTNAFNRYLASRESRLQPLQSLAGVGQTSVGRLGAAGQQYGAATGVTTGRYTRGATEAITGAANVRASGYVGAANALTSALGTGLNYWQDQKYMNMLKSRTSLPGSGE